MPYFPPENNDTFPSITEVENAFSVFSNMLNLDMSHYTIELLPDSTVGSRENEVYFLNSNTAINLTDGQLDIAFSFSNGRLSYIKMAQESDQTPFFLKPQASTQQWVLNFFDSYANSSDVSYIQDMRSALDIYGISNYTKPVGNSTIQVILGGVGGETGISIELSRAPEGITNTYDTVVVEFQSGAIELNDLWNNLPIGSYQFSLNQSEAEQIAKKYR